LRKAVVYDVHGAGQPLGLEQRFAVASPKVRTSTAEEVHKENLRALADAIPDAALAYVSSSVRRRSRAYALRGPTPEDGGSGLLFRWSCRSRLNLVLG
jgi:hypothetical protein